MSWLLLYLILYLSVIIWFRSHSCGHLSTWFCYQLIAKPGNKTAAATWPGPYNAMNFSYNVCFEGLLVCLLICVKSPPSCASCITSPNLKNYQWACCCIIMPQGIGDLFPFRPSEIYQNVISIISYRIFVVEYRGKFKSWNRNFARPWQVKHINFFYCCWSTKLLE